MALKRNNAYWKVGKTEIDWHDNVSLITVYGWDSQDDRDSGKTYSSIQTVSFIGSSPFTMDANNVDEAYAALKLKPDWSNAEDA